MGDSNRKDRGATTERWVASWYARLWPTAYPPKGTGSDVRGVPLDIEVKSRTGFRPLETLNQAAARRKPEHVLPPHAVLRMNGQGEASIPKFIVLRYLDDDTEILEELLRLRAEVDRKGIADAPQKD